MDFQVRGLEQFDQVAKALRAAGRTDLARDLEKGLTKSLEDLIPKTQAEARRILPSGGGLADKVASTPQKVQKRNSAQPGARLVVARRRGSGAAAANKGEVRHPVFGNRKVFVSQQVPPGWFDNTLEREGPNVVEAMRPVIAELLDRVAKEG